MHYGIKRLTDIITCSILINFIECHCAQQFITLTLSVIEVIVCSFEIASYYLLGSVRVQDIKYLISDIGYPIKDILYLI